MCKSKKSVTHDLFAIQEAFPNKNKKAKNELDFEHDFFKIINGHPLSISLVSSLKNGQTKLSLLSIFKTIQRLQKKQEGTKTDEGELILILSLQASLSYIKKQNKNFNVYSALQFFSICPSGINGEDCLKIFKNWNSFKIQDTWINNIQLLKAKHESENDNLIDAKSSFSHSKNMRNDRNTIYYMDPSLSKTAQLCMSESELSNADYQVKKYLTQKLENLMNSNQSSQDKWEELKKFEGNIWAAISRFCMEEDDIKEYGSRFAYNLGESAEKMKETAKVGMGIMNFIKKDILPGVQKKEEKTKSTLKRKGTFMTLNEKSLDQATKKNSFREVGEGLVSNTEVDKNDEKEKMKQHVLKLFTKDILQRNDSSPLESIKKTSDSKSKFQNSKFSSGLNIPYVDIAEVDDESSNSDSKSMDLSSDSDEPSSLQTQTSANILGDLHQKA